MAFELPTRTSVPFYEALFRRLHAHMDGVELSAVMVPGADGPYLVQFGTADSFVNGVEVVNLEEAYATSADYLVFASVVSQSGEITVIAHSRDDADTFTLRAQTWNGSAFADGAPSGVSWMTIGLPPTAA